ncbi:phosphate ABC transporter substrate-binding protein PstS [Kovacikia minuta CCNUW1]|uniref:phosphate ABC transporter substrate-binding protein PstS n=1 Tax=Kovacikia minuta TaxID=2931930 RepID=UPI001CCC0191|nr:phosphate ABC transporter substrate-binding protein PstS [Kovacikia minuta]UBF27271.1 phosphate ABC transporter substrate-binding protein PstS [Kovacikia minuta CCNUW1]
MAFSATIRRAVAASAVTVAIAVSPVLTAIAQAVSLSGAGATFPVPLYERYIAEFKKKNPDISVSYQGVGSGAGIRQVIQGTVQFGGSDAAMTDDEMAKVKGGVLLVPTAGGAVAVVYNLPSVSSLKLSSKTLPEIFGGRIKKWNDPRIVADNPGVSLPDSEIKTVVRADGSGTTFIFTNHLATISPYFKGRVGVGTAPNWTTSPIKGRGNPGVAAQVKNVAGSIGYVEYAYAKQNNLQLASVQNKKGEFVAPSLEAANKALSTIKFPDNYRVFVGNPEDGYPIVGLTWLLVYKQYPNPEQATAIKKWVEWVLSEGQELNGTLDYTRIPDSTAKEVIQRVQSEVK